jgi:transcription elongation factor GreA
MGIFYLRPLSVGTRGFIYFSCLEEFPMNDELTEVDIKKMKEEIEYRTKVLRPKLIEDVKFARGFGDLSENFEYKAAKREKNRNDGRVRYLERMIGTAKVISDQSGSNEVGLFDRVKIYLEEDEEEQDIQIVTTLRQNALKGLISKESPVGRAVLGHKAGDRVRVEVNPDYSYYIVIRSVEKGQDDESIPISEY